MGAFPEPAPRADDVCRRASAAETGADDGVDAVRWLPEGALRASRSTVSRLIAPRPTASRPRGRRLFAAAALAFLVGTAPDPAVAPSAAAHDRGDLRGDLRADLRETLRGDLHETLDLRGASFARPAAGDPASPADAWTGEMFQAETFSPDAIPGTAWAGQPLPEEQPPTPHLIEAQLRALVAATARARPAADPDEVLRFGGTSVRRGLAEAILRAAAATDVDPVYMMALADKESSFSPAVKAATSSAEGLFQFIARSWLAAVKTFGPRHGLVAEAAAIELRDGDPVVADEARRAEILALRRDPYLAGLMAGEMLKRDRARIESRLGRELKVSEFYFAHFLGEAGAGRLMELAEDKPSALAVRAFRAAAKANRSLFTERQGRRRRSLTVAEVYDRIDRMIDGRLDRFAEVTRVVQRF
jgi:hypothetical protein